MSGHSSRFDANDYSPCFQKITSKIFHSSVIHQALDKIRQSKTVVFTNGCFDILHEGHIVSLAFAKCQGDILVVGMNSDESVRQLKGNSRPVMNERCRATILAAITFVDFVAIFHESTPLDLIRAVRPDVLVKGGDYWNKAEKIVGTDEVLSWGGRVLFSPYRSRMSSFKIIEKIRGSNDQ